jgi:hypothetical protein
MPTGERNVSGGSATAKGRVVHDVVLQQGEGVQQFEAGRCTQRRVVVVGAAQPPEVHECRSDALAAVDKFPQDVPRNRQSRGLQVRRALSGNELPNDRLHRIAHGGPPVLPGMRPGAGHGPKVGGVGTRYSVDCSQCRIPSRTLGDYPAPFSAITILCTHFFPNMHRLRIEIFRIFGALSTGRLTKKTTRRTSRSTHKRRTINA